MFAAAFAVAKAIALNWALAGPSDRGLGSGYGQRAFSLRRLWAATTFSTSNEPAPNAPQALFAVRTDPGCIGTPNTRPVLWGVCCVLFYHRPPLALPPHHASDERGIGKAPRTVGPGWVIHMVAELKESPRDSGRNDLAKRSSGPPNQRDRDDKGIGPAQRRKQRFFGNGLRCGPRRKPAASRRVRGTALSWSHRGLAVPLGRSMPSPV